MFLAIVGSFKCLSLKKAYLNVFLPITFLISLFFHKFAAVFFVFATIGFYFLKESSIKENISSILKSPPVHLLIAFWVWASITLLWTINFENGITTSLKFLGMISLGILIFSTIPLVSNKTIRNLFSILVWSIVFVIMAYLIMPLINQAYEKPLAYFLALFFFPTALYLYEPLPQSLKFLVSVFFGFALCAMKLSGAQSGLIGFLLGSLVFLMTVLKPQSTTVLLKLFTFLWALLTPVYMMIFNYHEKILSYINIIGSSLYHRFCIWNFVTHKIFERPLLGWGLGASKKFPGSNDLVFLGVAPDQCKLLEDSILNSICWAKASFNNMPLHPHNNALQVYLELGLVGGIIYSLFLASVFQLFLKTFQDKVVLATANGMAVLTLVIFNMSQSIWHMWLLSWIILSFALLYAVSLYRARKHQDEDQDN